MKLLSQFRALRQRQSSIGGEISSPQPLHHLSVLSQPRVGNSHTPESNDVLISRRHAQMVQDLRFLLPSTCRWLGPEDVDLVGDQIAAGGSANIWGATHDGHEVVVKSYRRSASSDITRIVEVRYNRGLC